MASIDGDQYIRSLASYIRSNDRRLAAALHSKRNGTSASSTDSAASALSALYSWTTAGATAPSPMRPVTLSLSPHHLFYLLTRFEELGISVGPMNVRLETLHNEASHPNYVSFLNAHHQSRRKDLTSDSASMRSVSSIRSVMSGMSSLWSMVAGSGQPSEERAERIRKALEVDVKYIYSCFTKLPALRLSPDRGSQLIEGYEEFPFDTAVPLLAFKNVSSLEVVDLDVRQFYGWDQISERVRSLVVKRGGIEDASELIVDIVLDDMDKRRHRSAKHSPTGTDYGSNPPSPNLANASFGSFGTVPQSPRPGSGAQNNSGPRSASPRRPASARDREGSWRLRSPKLARSDTNSSTASSVSASSSSTVQPSGAHSPSQLPVSKWRFLRHLSLADNALHTVSQASVVPLAGTLVSMDLSSNLFLTIPQALANLTALKSLNLANNMIESLHSLTHSPLAAVTVLSLRSNRLRSLAGIERLPTLERLDLRDNKLTDPTELARLTSLPNLREVYVADNPFCKTHASTYRITIFNLFRSTPGYEDDIVLDGQAPGLVERRALVDRVIDVPVPAAAIPEFEEVGTPESSGPSRVDSPASAMGPPEVKSRKKKAGRRRIVELSAQDAAAQANATAAGSGGVISDDASSIQTDAATLGTSLGDKGEEYRKKIEALRNEVGSGWLRVLEEQEWKDEQKRREEGAAKSVSAPPISRA
ncbi:hypothetical protein YB2330_005576 [Saitoella coloradoensis]